jgi:hypothetical protein
MTLTEKQLELVADRVLEQFALKFPKTTAAMKRATWAPEEEAECLAELFAQTKVEGKEQ